MGEKERGGARDREGHTAGREKKNKPFFPFNNGSGG